MALGKYRVERRHAGPRRPLGGVGTWVPTLPLACVAVHSTTSSSASAPSGPAAALRSSATASSAAATAACSAAGLPSQKAMSAGLPLRSPAAASTSRTCAAERCPSAAAVGVDMHRRRAMAWPSEKQRHTVAMPPTEGVGHRRQRAHWRRMETRGRQTACVRTHRLGQPREVGALRVRPHRVNAGRGNDLAVGREDYEGRDALHRKELRAYGRGRQSVVCIPTHLERGSLSRSQLRKALRSGAPRSAPRLVAGPRRAPRSTAWCQSTRQTATGPGPPSRTPPQSPCLRP